jgi:hypothetical protein
MWMKMIAFGATASILALSACAVSEDEYAEGMDSTVAEDEASEALLAAEGQFCGGFAGFACPAGYTCEDDRRDSCDPARGGADCGGLCRRERRPNPSACRRHDPTKSYVSRRPDQCAVLRLNCQAGSHAFSNECGCGCEKEKPCGKNVCGAGFYCCNASCGICAPEGGACIQIACTQPL